MLGILESVDINTAEASTGVITGKLSCSFQELRRVRRYRAFIWEALESEGA